MSRYGAYDIQGSPGGYRLRELASGEGTPQRGGRSAVHLGNQYEVASDKYEVSGLMGGASAQYAGGASQGGAGSSTSSMSMLMPTMQPLLYGLTDQSPASTRFIVRDMFDNDPVTGGVADLIANMVYSTVSLTCDDEKHAQKFHDLLDDIRFVTLFPLQVKDHIVDGAHAAVFQKDHNDHWNLLPLDLMQIVLTPMPLYNLQPLITLKLAMGDITNAQKAAKGNEYLEKQFSAENLKMLQGNKPLPPENSIYIPRNSLSWRWEGTSYFSRNIGIWLLEKALLRASITAAMRRPAPTMHIRVGSEEFPPTHDQLIEVATQFLNAEIDPVSRVVTTRNDVEATEVGSMAEMLKWSDVSDGLVAQKLKGVGASEAMLSGEASFSQVDASTSAFVQNVRRLRDGVVRAGYIDRIFPMYAYDNGIRKSRRASENSQLEMWPQKTLTVSQLFKNPAAYNYDRSSVFTVNGERIDIKNLDIPKVHFDQNLHPEGDTAYLDMLTRLRNEWGVPVPMRLATVAAGVNLDDILRAEKQDTELLNKAKKYRDVMDRIMPPPQPEESSVQEAPVRNRKFNPENSIFKRNRRGEMVPVTSPSERLVLNERADRVLAEGLSRFAERENFRIRRDQESRRKRTYNYK